LVARFSAQLRHCVVIGPRAALLLEKNEVCDAAQLCTHMWRQAGVNSALTWLSRTPSKNVSLLQSGHAIPVLIVDKMDNL
jgi:hypothetical protein